MDKDDYKYLSMSKIDKELEPRKPRSNSREYGMMGLSLHNDLKDRLKTYSRKINVPMAKIIRVLLINYLNQKENISIKKTEQDIEYLNKLTKGEDFHKSQEQQLDEKEMTEKIKSMTWEKANKLVNNIVLNREE